ncbi:MAG TPA: glycosyltransferase family 9 protein [Longimicrobiales bacterium]|nr:glycosyltransferase family 9 protein [Longimicrobiales bacterium]
MSTPRREPPRHVCIVLLTAIGDVVHALPVANALKRAWPDTRITWIAEPVPAGMVSPHPAVDQVIVYEKKKGIEGVRALWSRMRRERFDLTLNLMPYFKSNWPTLFSRAPERWTFDRGRARDGVWLLGNHRLPGRPRAHTQDMFIEFVQALGVDPFPIEWRLVITDEERALQQALVAQLEGKPGVAVVPTSSMARKDWPAERYVPVVDAIHDLGGRAVLVGGPGEREVAAARVIEAGAARKPVWMMGDVARSLIWKIDACSLLVGPDTGPVHIARALEVPVVGLYGHTNPYRVGPWRAYEDLWIDMYTEPGQAPDPSDFTPKHGRMERITSDMVIEKVLLGMNGGRWANRRRERRDGVGNGGTAGLRGVNG